MSLLEKYIVKLARVGREEQEIEPLISVYTPTYNRGEILIERAVKSVLKQTYKNFEYIIIGDNCTDNTEELINKINDPRIKFYNMPKREKSYPKTARNHWLAGPVAPSNEALKRVKGEWIARIDDDDIWTKTHLAELLYFARANNYEFVSSAYEEKRNGILRKVEGVHAHSENYGYLFTRLNSPLIGGTSTWLYRNYLKFMKYNPNCWKKSWNCVNDTDLSDRFYKAGVRMGFLDKETMRIIPREGSSEIGWKQYEEKEKEMEEFYK